jgi:hypothetical protein
MDRELSPVTAKALFLLKYIKYEDLDDLIKQWIRKLQIEESRICIEYWPGWTRDSGTWIFYGLESEDVSAFTTSLNSKLKGKPKVYFEKECCRSYYFLRTDR